MVWQSRWGFYCKCGFLNWIVMSTDWNSLSEKVVWQSRWGFYYKWTDATCWRGSFPISSWFHTPKMRGPPTLTLYDPGLKHSLREHSSDAMVEELCEYSTLLLIFLHSTWFSLHVVQYHDFWVFKSPFWPLLARKSKLFNCDTVELFSLSEGVRRMIAQPAIQSYHWLQRVKKADRT